MPNHVTNAITISHDDPEKIKWLKETCIDNGTLDFNEIISMPLELKGITSPVRIVTPKEKEEEIEKNKESISAYKIISLTQEMSDDYEKRFGANNWYDWAIKNWGTKWNSYDGEVIHEDDDSISIKFLTAWSPPDNIFAKLLDMGFEINGYWLGEGEYEPQMIGNGGEWGTYTEINWYGTVKAN